MTQLIEKLAGENKNIYLLGDFNIDLINKYGNIETTAFFDTLTANLFVRHIILPTRITNTNKSLIDNIFSNSENFKEGISGNFTVPISDHLAQFLLIPGSQEKITESQSKYSRNRKNFDRENFILDLLEIDWSTILMQTQKIQMEDCIFLSLKIRKLIKKEIYHENKPWITRGIKQLMIRRDKLYK